jgi:hypothetical protein
MHCSFKTASSFTLYCLIPQNFSLPGVCRLTYNAKLKLSNDRHSPYPPPSAKRLKQSCNFKCSQKEWQPLLSGLARNMAPGYTDIKGADKKSNLIDLCILSILCARTFTTWFVSSPRAVALTASSGRSIQMVAIITMVLYNTVTLLWVGGQIAIDRILKEATCDSCKTQG